MTERTMLLVEDHPDDQALTLRALQKNNIANEVVIVHDGAQALDVVLILNEQPRPGGV